MRKKLLVTLVATFAVCGPAGIAEAQSVSLDHVDGLQGIDSIAAGQETVFHLRVNTADTVISGMTNGFRIHSPDGAGWTTTTGVWTEFVTDSMFPQQLVLPHGVTGSAADTIAFAGFLWNTMGIPSGFDSVAWQITIGPIDAGYEGKTICLDSSWFPRFGVWRWTPWRGGDIPQTPAWDGPHCYTVAAPASCCEIRGDVDDNGFGPDISDLVYLMEYVDEGGPAPPCLEQANVNGSGGDADSEDLDYLVAHMFSGGPPPVPCP